MRSSLTVLAVALVLGTATLASAQTIESGTVVRLDPQASVVVLDDGRMYRVTPNTVLVVESRPAPFTALRPGQRVVVQSGEMVTFREGQYVAVAPSPPVIAQTAPISVTTVPVGVRQTVYGTVTNVDSDGQIKIRTERDSFEVRIAAEALRQIKKGDNVTIDLTITPPGAPSASPGMR